MFLVIFQIQPIAVAIFSAFETVYNYHRPEIDYIT